MGVEEPAVRGRSLPSFFGNRYTISAFRRRVFTLDKPTILVVRHLCTIALLLSAPAFGADCIPFDQAPKHIGDTECITGKVVRVHATRKAHYLDFCEDYRLCPFSVVIFSHDVKNVGDVRQLAGKVIEIRGEIKEYNDRAEIILDSRKQLSGQAALLPPLPKTFDVEQRGHFNAGTFRSKKGRATSKKKQTPTLPIEIPEDAELE